MTEIPGKYEVRYDFFGKGERVVKSPWLRPEEAAAYCGISRSMFEKRAERLPCRRDGRTRLYHVKVLDQWLEGSLDVPFDPQA